MCKSQEIEEIENFRKYVIVIDYRIFGLPKYFQKMKAFSGNAETIGELLNSFELFLVLGNSRAKKIIFFQLIYFIILKQ
jgi:hypothetical protein